MLYRNFIFKYNLEDFRVSKRCVFFTDKEGSKYKLFGAAIFAMDSQT
jgi:hypothetical protein